MMDKFQEFLQDEEAWDMYITGPAGTGKTTALGDLVNYCIQEGVNTIVCAFTHKACDILASKLPSGSNIATLHSVLRKRPSINDQAVKAQHVEVSRQFSNPEKYEVMFVDEFSMVGEQDYMDIVAMQDPEYEGAPRMKVVYIGDLNQLPPVGDMQTIQPNGGYWVRLSHIYRQKDGNKLLDTLGDLVKMIEGGPVKPLDGNNNFKRGFDLVSSYKSQDISDDKVLLAYTNMRVEGLNAEIKGRAIPEQQDTVFSPTRREHYIIDSFVPKSSVFVIKKSFGDNSLEFNSKYKTLEHLLTMNDIGYVSMVEEDSNEVETYAYVFGHYQYKLKLEELRHAAAKSNAVIEQKHNSQAKMWAAANPHDKLARERAKAWRDYLTFKECVICIDFPFAMTIHKSQGSTYDTVLIDTDDLYRCANRDFKMYLRLMYVAISRSSNMVYTN